MNKGIIAILSILSLSTLWAGTSPKAILLNPRMLLGEVDYYSEIWRDNVITYGYGTNLDMPEALERLMAKLGEDWSLETSEHDMPMPAGIQVKNMVKKDGSVSIMVMLRPNEPKEKETFNAENMFMIIVNYETDI